MAALSRFARKLTAKSGIGRLMEDLGAALANNSELLMLGGGNPAHIPQVQQYFRQTTQTLLEKPGLFEKVIGDYDPPQGNIEFIDAVTGLLKKQFGWPIEPQNVALTNGSQSAFFILFNIFAGDFEDGSKKKILLPLTPEYIGYCDVGLSDELFVAQRPLIKHIDKHMFKYYIDFEHLEITEQVGAICVSRPTNPTGNVLTDFEIQRLSELARAHNIPLIIDNAYGTPFPNIIFTEAAPIWNENTVVCLSLSKLGLPAARTGIVVARPQIIEMVAHANAILSLAPGSFGAAIAIDLVRSGQIIELSRKVIKPFYQQKAKFALEQLCERLEGLEFRIHCPEGAIFLWLWLPELPVTAAEFYERLKARGVLVVPGHYFFPGLADDWKHKHQCIRLNYSQSAGVVADAAKVIAEQAKRIYAGH